ncbi:MAG TPA: hypothetical protein VE222_05115, partial [Nitrospiraceae bacterium]|nr:hypothetical protein [Nitrospiraceae bacterium]
MITKRIPRWIAVHLFLGALFCAASALGQGENNPTGVTGIYNGNITTGGNYDPFTGNAMRVVDDIVVPGAVGAYPLKWTRYANSRGTSGFLWQFSYSYYMEPMNQVSAGFPDGRIIGNGFSVDCPPVPAGVEEKIGTWNGYHAIRLADGGVVAFSDTYWITIIGKDVNGNTVTNPAAQMDPLYVVDPYGQITTISYDPVSYTRDGATASYHQRSRVTEPGGRYLQISYTSTDPTDALVSRVEAFDGQNHMLDSVDYTWDPTWRAPTSSEYKTVLNRVRYSDGQSAIYTYTATQNGQNDYNHNPVLFTADDVRYAGPMRQIAYDYHLALVADEKNLITRESVSALAAPTPANSDPTEQRTETRGDGASRTFIYGHANDPNSDCPTKTKGKLLS